MVDLWIFVSNRDVEIPRTDTSAQHVDLKIPFGRFLYLSSSHFDLHLAIFSHKLKWQHVLHNTRFRISIKCWFVTKCSCRQPSESVFRRKKLSVASNDFRIDLSPGECRKHNVFYFGVWIHGICRNGCDHIEHNLLSQKQINTVLLCLA